MHRVIRNLNLLNTNVRGPRRGTRRRRRNHNSPRIARHNLSSILRDRTGGRGQSQTSSSVPTRHNVIITATRTNLPILTILTRRTYRPIDGGVNSIVTRVRGGHRLDAGLSSNDRDDTKIKTRRRVASSTSVHTKQCQRVLNGYLGSTRGGHLRRIRGSSEFLCAWYIVALGALPIKI